MPLPNVLIVGGGVSGLVLAIRLRQSGLNPTLIEKTPEWTPKGSGIHLYSNALRALQEIDVAEEIVARGSSHDYYEYADPQDNGQVRVRYPRLAGSSVPALVNIPRQDLHDILIARAKAVGLNISLGTRVLSLDQFKDRVRIGFSDGEAGDYDIVVGADGIYSQVRGDVFGENEPVYTGQAIWRAMLERHRDSIDPKILFAGGGKMFGIVPVNSRQVYLLAGMPDPDRPRYAADELHLRIREYFDGFGGLASYYLDQIDAPEQVTYTAIEMVVQPAPWYRGRVFLVGDAAHASPPYLAQGAAMAIEDSIVLGELITQDLPLQAIQDQYMERRFARASLIQNTSLERNRDRYQGGSYEVRNGKKSERFISLEKNAQRQIDELYAELAKPI